MPGSKSNAITPAWSAVLIKRLTSADLQHQGGGFPNTPEMQIKL